MDRLYKQNKALIVDTYEDILAEKQAVYQKKQVKPDLPTRNEATQCEVELKEAGTGMDDHKKPSKRAKPAPISPISSRTRGAARKGGK